MLTRRSLLLASLAALLSPAAVPAADPPAGPAYQIVLRSRHAEATPTRTKDAQTGGGYVVVEQPEPNTIVVTMGGSAVVGSDCHGSAAGIDFNLEQDLDIIPTRAGRPAAPRRHGRARGRHAPGDRPRQVRQVVRHRRTGPGRGLPGDRRDEPAVRQREAVVRGLRAGIVDQLPARPGRVHGRRGFLLPDRLVPHRRDPGQGRVEPPGGGRRLRPGPAARRLLGGRPQAVPGGPAQGLRLQDRRPGGRGQPGRPEIGPQN